jgi:hypothetical protein
VGSSELSCWVCEKRLGVWIKNIDRDLARTENVRSVTCAFKIEKGLIAINSNDLIRLGRERHELIHLIHALKIASNNKTRNAEFAQ